MEITEPNEGLTKTNEASMMVTKIITAIPAFLFIIASLKEKGLFSHYFPKINV
jgi:hypothetical protein